MRFVGLDLSLTGTGVALVEHGEATTRTIVSRGKKDDDLGQRARRIADLAARVIDVVDEVEDRTAPGVVVAVERPSFASTGGSHHDRSGLWWTVVLGVGQYTPVDIIEISPSTVKKYATGRGNANKDEVLAAVVRRYRDVEVADNNQADALVLAAIAARLHDEPIEIDFPKAHLAALDVLRR